MKIPYIVHFSLQGNLRKQLGVSRMILKLPGKNLDLFTDFIPSCNKQLLNTHPVLGVGG